jgi:hypothetical protein
MKLTTESFIFGHSNNINRQKDAVAKKLYVHEFWKMFYSSLTIKIRQVNGLCGYNVLLKVSLLKIVISPHFNNMFRVPQKKKNSYANQSIFWLAIGNKKLGNSLTNHGKGIH